MLSTDRLVAKYLFAKGLEEGAHVKQILLALGGKLPPEAKKVTYLSNGLQFRHKVGKDWRLVIIFTRPQGDWAVEFWQIKPRRQLSVERLRDLGRLRQVVDTGMRQV